MLMLVTGGCNLKLCASRIAAAVALLSAVALIVALPPAIDGKLPFSAPADKEVAVTVADAERWCLADALCAEARRKVHCFNQWFRDAAHGHRVVLVQAAVVPVAASASAAVVAATGETVTSSSSLPPSQPTSIHWHLGLQVIPFASSQLISDSAPTTTANNTTPAGADDGGRRSGDTVGIRRGDVYLKVNASLALSCRTFLAAAWLEPAISPEQRDGDGSESGQGATPTKIAAVLATGNKLVWTLRRGLRRVALGWISSHIPTVAASVDRLLSCDAFLHRAHHQDKERSASATPSGGEGCAAGSLSDDVHEIMARLSEETQEWILALWLIFEVVVACPIHNNTASFYCPYLNILPPPVLPPPTASAVFFGDAELSSLAGTAVYQGVRTYRKRIERLRRWLSVDLAPTLDVTWKRDIAALRIATDRAASIPAQEGSATRPDQDDLSLFAVKSAWRDEDLSARQSTCDSAPLSSRDEGSCSSGTPKQPERQLDDLAVVLRTVGVAWQSISMPQQPWSEWALAVLWSRQVWWAEPPPYGSSDTSGSRSSVSRQRAEAHLAPMHDLANCVETGEGSARVAIHKTQLSPDDRRYVETRAIHSAVAGEEIFENYGETNSFYLLFHGFVLEHNAHDCALLLRPQGDDEDMRYSRPYDTPVGEDNDNGRSRNVDDRPAATRAGVGSDTSLVSELLTPSVRRILRKHGLGSHLTTMNCLRVIDENNGEDAGAGARSEGLAEGDLNKNPLSAFPSGGTTATVQPVDFVPPALDRWLTVLRAAYLIQRLDDEALEQLLLPVLRPRSGSMGRMTLIRLSNFSRSIANAAGPTSDAVQYFSDPTDSIEANEFVLAAAQQYVARQRELIASDKSLAFQEERALQEVAAAAAVAATATPTASATRVNQAKSVWATIVRYVRQQRRQFAALERHLSRLQRLVNLQLHASPWK